MGYKILHSVPAELDFDSIIHYITVSLNNPAAARNLRDEYYEKLAMLKESPCLYSAAPIEELARSGYHRFSFGNYIAFYQINDEEQKVNIIRIFYKRQDYINML